MQRIISFVLLLIVIGQVKAQTKTVTEQFIADMSAIRKVYAGLDNQQFRITINHLTDSGVANARKEEKLTCVIMNGESLVENQTASSWIGADFRVDVDKVNKMIAVDRLADNDDDFSPAGFSAIPSNALANQYNIQFKVDTTGDEDLYSYTLTPKVKSLRQPLYTAIYFNPTTYLLKQLIVETPFKEPIPTEVNFDVDSLQRAAVKDTALIRQLKQQYKDRKLYSSYTYSRLSPAGTSHAVKFSRNYYVYRDKDGTVRPASGFADYQLYYNLTEVDEMSGENKDRLLKAARGSQQ